MCLSYSVGPPIGNTSAFPADLIRFFLQMTTGKALYALSRVHKRNALICHHNRRYYNILHKLHLCPLLEKRYGYTYMYLHYPSLQREGYERSYYPDSTLATEYHWKNGVLEGPLRVWHPNGQPELECLYSGGQRNGCRKKWNEHGELRHQSEWKDDMTM